MTGAEDCSQKQGICLFNYDGKLAERVQIILSSSLTVALIPLGGCGEVHVLAVGCGGKGGGRVQDFGGGSGYIEWATGPDRLARNRKLLVEVGKGQQASVVTLWNKEEVLVKAQPGETGTCYGGGAGYSGGGDGYYGCCDSAYGGSDGGNGQNSTNYPGGVGSGLNLSSIPVKGFTQVK